MIFQGMTFEVGDVYRNSRGWTYTIKKIEETEGWPRIYAQRDPPLRDGKFSFISSPNTLKSMEKIHGPN